MSPMLIVERHKIDLMSWGDSVGVFSSKSAAMPAIRAQDIEVPEEVV